MKKLLFLTLFIYNSFIFSQTPQGINYQAIAYKSTGAIVVSGTIKIRLSILNNTSTGTALYTELHTKTTTAQGLYNLVIGQGTSPTGTFTAIPWGIGNKFLKVELDPLGLATPNYTATGTSQLMSVPYALYSESSKNAQNAQTADNVNPANSIKTISNVATLRQTTGINSGDVVFVRGYYTNNDGGGGSFIWNNDPAPVSPATVPTYTDNGGTIIVPTGNTSGRWLRIIDGNTVNVKWFGAKADASYYGVFFDLVTGTDNQPYFREAIKFCILKNYELNIPPGDLYDYTSTTSPPVKTVKNYQYKVNSTIVIDGPINIKGQLSSSIIGTMNNTSAIFDIIGCYRGKIENLDIIGYQYKPKAGIWFKTSTSQAMELNNVRINTCNFGVYCNEGGAVDRMVFNRCDFSSNVEAGFYLISNTTNTAPLTFIHTIMNSNGYQDWMGAQGIVKPYNCYQFYAINTTNLSYIGGQISKHFSPENQSLVYLENGRGANFQGVDIEGELLVRPDGSTSVPFKGSAFHLKNFTSFNLTQSEIWQINTTAGGSVFYFEGNCGNINIQTTDLDNVRNRNFGNYTYSINVDSTNFYNNPPITNDPTMIDPNYNFTTTFLNFDGQTHKLSTGALNSLEKSKMEILTNIGGPIVPNLKFDSIFKIHPTNTSSSNYLITNDLQTTTYIEKNISNASVVYIEIECSQNSFEPDGQLFIQELDASNIQIGNVTYASLKATNTINGNFYSYVKKDISLNTKKIRYGFVNKNSGCVGCNIPDHATVKGLTVYIDYRNPISKRQRMNTDY